MNKNRKNPGLAIDFDQLCQRVMNDRDMALTLLKKANIRLGKDASEIQTAIQDRNAEALEKAAHKLKGSAANLSAESLRQVCEMLEVASKAGDWDAIHKQVNSLVQAIDNFRQSADILIREG